MRFENLLTCVSWLFAFADRLRIGTSSGFVLLDFLTVQGVGNHLIVRDETSLDSLVKSVGQLDGVPLLVAETLDFTLYGNLLLQEV